MKCSSSAPVLRSLRSPMHSRTPPRLRAPRALARRVRPHCRRAVATGWMGCPVRAHHGRLRRRYRRRSRARLLHCQRRRNCALYSVHGASQGPLVPPRLAHAEFVGQGVRGAGRGPHRGERRAHLIECPLVGRIVSTRAHRTMAGEERAVLRVPRRCQ